MENMGKPEARPTNLSIRDTKTHHDSPVTLIDELTARLQRAEEENRKFKEYIDERSRMTEKFDYDTSLPELVNNLHLVKTSAGSPYAVFELYDTFIKLVNTSINDDFSPLVRQSDLSDVVMANVEEYVSIVSSAIRARFSAIYEVPCHPLEPVNHRR